MREKPDEAANATWSTLDAETVIAYLRRHPDFLADRPEIIACLTPPEFRRGESVLDMQRFMIERLRSEIDLLKLREHKLLAVAEASLADQTRVQAAALAILNAQSFEHLIRLVHAELAAKLGIEAVALCLETGEVTVSGRDLGVVLLKPGALAGYLADGADVVLADDVEGDRAIFGPHAARVRSHAFVRLKFGVKAPAALLAFGSDRREGFHPDQGTELLKFLARVLEVAVRRWLSVAS